MSYLMCIVIYYCTNKKLNIHYLMQIHRLHGHQKAMCKQSHRMFLMNSSFTDNFLELHCCCQIIHNADPNNLDMQGSHRVLGGSCSLTRMSATRHSTVVNTIVVCFLSFTGGNVEGVVTTMIYRPPLLLAAIEQCQFLPNLAEKKHHPSLQFLEYLQLDWTVFHGPYQFTWALDFHQWY